MIGLTPTKAAVPRVISRHLPELRAALDQQRRFRLDQLDELDAAALVTPPTAGEPRTEIAVALRMAAAIALAEIDAALNRLRNGCYGWCAQCDNAIPLERLEVLPMVRLCMRCQYAVESPQSHALNPGHPLNRSTGMVA